MFDVYISPKQRVFLIDLAPFGPDSGTDALLFEWDDLTLPDSEEESEELPYIAFRTIDSEEGMVLNEGHVSRLPWDVREYNSEVSEILAKLNIKSGER